MNPIVRPRTACCVLALLAFSVPIQFETLAGTPSFKNDVMPVLLKSGCNAGVCHGNANGKGGFKLSLWGQDPDLDHIALTRGDGGRRVNLLDAKASLLLLKPAAQVAHEGGRRFGFRDVEYQILSDWIAAGAPNSKAGEPQLTALEVSPGASVIVAPENRVQLQVIATFSDGTRRDVTRLTAYSVSNLGVEVTADGLAIGSLVGERTVIARFLDIQKPIRLAFVPQRSDFQWDSPTEKNYIDSLVFKKLRSLRMNASAVSDDNTFVRRAYFDAIGIPPTSDEARRFIASTDPDRRVKLIDSLLERDEFADFWALKWSDVLRNEEKVLDAKGVEVFHRWIRDSFATDRPLNEFVRELVSARGSTYKTPPANFWRANREPLMRGETTAQLFLGIRMQCAKCHNHPFERWTQDDYYSWAANFARIDYKIVDNKRRDKLDKHEFLGEQIVEIKPEGEVKNARTGQDAEPRFLGGTTPQLESDADRLIPVADWITSPDNRMFALAQVNRIWFHLLGRGLVTPIDDFRITNPAVNPELLETLGEDFVENNFSVRHLVGTIMKSHVYELSAVPNKTNADDESNFSRALVVRLSAEQLLDAQCQVLGTAADFNGYDSGIRAGQLAGVERVRLRDKPPGSGDRFLTMFGRPQRLLACECERSGETTLSQALLLIGGEGLNDRITQKDNRLGQLVAAGMTDAQIVDELYWNALSRPPSDAELKGTMSHIGTSDDRIAALQDVAWALLNAKEFLFRH